MILYNSTTFSIFVYTKYEIYGDYDQNNLFKFIISPNMLILFD